MEGLKKAHGFRLYNQLNIQSFVNETEDSFEFQMNDCRAQSVRKRHSLPDFPCKSVGLVEYAEFARTINSHIKTICFACPPDNHPAKYYCAWKFYIVN